MLDQAEDRVSFILGVIYKVLCFAKRTNQNVGNLLARSGRSP